MSKHEFYADPTLFDQWQMTAGNWLCAKGEKVCPYTWVIAFTLFGAAMVCISMFLLGILLQHTVVQAAPAWNDSLARGTTSVLALATAQWLFRQALDAWPGEAALPGQLRRAARYVGWRPAAGPPKADRISVKQAPKSSTAAADQEAVQAFFAGVRAAGVNVVIARALLAAGIRSPRQLRTASDKQLVAIRGVGPATVRKLRAQFG
jgi:hypothetical protein